MPKKSTLRLTTTRSVAALPVTGKDALYWDCDFAGFSVRVQRNGRHHSACPWKSPPGTPPTALPRALFAGAVVFDLCTVL